MLYKINENILVRTSYDHIVYISKTVTQKLQVRIGNSIKLNEGKKMELCLSVKIFSIDIMKQIL